jgi:hypothetical protein
MSKAVYLRLCLGATFMLSMALEARSQSTPPISPRAAPAAQPTQRLDVQELATWERGMKATKQPHSGCFTATFPDLKWQETACTRAPVQRPQHRPARPGVKPALATITIPEAAQEVVALSNQSSFTTVLGSFSTVRDLKYFSPATSGFSLQLNPQVEFPTPTCNLSSLGSQSGCSGWLQFVVNSAVHSFVYMELWLFDFGDCSKAPQLPTNPPPTHQWARSGDGNDCEADTASVLVPLVTLDQLASITLRGSVSDGMDTVIFTQAGKMSSISIPQSIMQLTGLWTGASFNLYGYSNGAQVNLNAGAGLIVTMETETADSSTATLGVNKYTGESNNMIVALPGCVRTSGQGRPIVQFVEAVNAGMLLGATNTCAFAGPTQACLNAQAALASAQHALSTAQAALGTERCDSPNSLACARAVQQAQQTVALDGRLEQQACL